MYEYNNCALQHGGSTYHVFDTSLLMSNGSEKMVRPTSLAKSTYSDGSHRGGSSIPSERKISPHADTAKDEAGLQLA